MSDKEVVLTYEGLQKLEEELEYLKTTKKKVESNDDEIALAIACAIHQGQKA